MCAANEETDATTAGETGSVLMHTLIYAGTNGCHCCFSL